MLVYQCDYAGTLELSTSSGLHLRRGRMKLLKIVTSFFLWGQSWGSFSLRLWSSWNESLSRLKALGTNRVSGLNRGDVSESPFSLPQAAGLALGPPGRTVGLKLFQDKCLLFHPVSHHSRTWLSRLNPASLQTKVDRAGKYAHGLFSPKCIY